MTSEQGKPLAEARGESRLCRRVRRILRRGGQAHLWRDQSRRLRADSRILVVRQPIGVVAAITPWNFPAAMITRKVAPALAAGCTGVVKPAHATPLTALALGELAQRAGMPPGVLNILTGDASAIGKALCEHPAVRFVGFTGSTEVGKLLMRQAASDGEEGRAGAGRQRAVHRLRRRRSRRRGRRRDRLEVSATWARPASAPTASSRRRGSTTRSSTSSTRAVGLAARRRRNPSRRARRGR